jgi:response regulator RpfG family c-di-GMP phosphodiesterase
VKKILLIDQEEESKEMIRSLLKEIPAQSVEINNGGRRKWKRVISSINGAIIDVSNQKNLEVVEEIRKLRPELPIIVTTNENSESVEHQLRAVGVFFFFIKPFRIREMREVIKVSLEYYDSS